MTDQDWRRVRTLYISEAALLGALGDVPMLLRRETNLPDDARVLDCKFVPAFRQFELTVWSKTFNPVPELNVPPVMSYQATVYIDSCQHVQDGA